MNLLREYIRELLTEQSGDLIAKGLKGPDIGKAMARAEGDAYDKLVKEGL